MHHRIVRRLLAALIAAGTPAIALPAIASDLGQVRQPDGTTGPHPTTISIEAGPEFYALNGSDYNAGNYAKTSVKAAISHAFDNRFVVSGSFEGEFKETGAQQYYVEAAIGYHLHFDRFTLTPSAAIGDTFDSTGLGDNGDSNAVYYALYLAGDLEIDPSWTWNAFKLRYRDAFDYQWVTPQVATGVTYAIDDRSAVSANVGYSWKDTGEGLLGDNISASIGLKHSF